MDRPKSETRNVPDRPRPQDCRGLDAQQAEELEDGSLDPAELLDEPAWWDEGSDDET